MRCVSKAPQSRKLQLSHDEPRTRRFASFSVPPWARLAERKPGGIPILNLLGWLLLAAGAASLLWLIAAPVSATVGSPPWTYNADATGSTAPGFLPTVVIGGPLLGFNLVYWFSRPASRTRQLGCMVALLLAELLLLTAAVVWVTGAGYQAGAVFDLTADSADTVIGMTLLLLVVLAAAGIMFWLGTSTTFEDQRAEYLHDGRTTVTATRMGVRSHLALVLAAFVIWLLFLVPVFLGHNRRYTDATTNLTWPERYYDGNELSSAIDTYQPLVGLLWGFALSLLVEKVLYQGVWAARAKASSKRPRASWFARTLVRFRHWPFTIGGLLSTFIVPSAITPDGIHWLDLTTGAATDLVLFGIGLLFFRWEWKARDLTRRTVRLHLAGAA